MAHKIFSFAGVDVYRADKCDVNGNPRCIVHFSDFLTEKENRETGVLEGYEIAHKRAKKIGFRKYTAREFGGGFICQYDYCGGREIAERVASVRPSE